MTKKKVEKKCKNVSYCIYKRQSVHIDQLVADEKFASKSELVREALDFFFMFPYFRNIAEKQVRSEIEKEVTTKLYEEFYNKKVIKVLE